MSSHNEMFNKTVFQDRGPDAILNISVISNATYLKIQLYMNDLAWNKQVKFQLFIMRFDEIINKIVIQDGGPDAILNISVIQKTTFMKI